MPSRDRIRGPPSGVAPTLRFLDIALAVMIGVSALSGIAALSPRGGDAVSARMALETHLRDQIVSFLDEKGLPWILQAPPSVLCSSLAADMSSPFVFVSTGRLSCGTLPPGGAVASNLTLPLGSNEVVIGAWSNA